MRKFLLTIAVVGAFVALGGAAFAVAASTQSADVYGVGGGKTDVGTFKFDLSAHTTGVRDFGHVGVTQTVGNNQVSYYLDVDCVNVVGNHASIGGVVRKVTPFPNTFGYAVGNRFLVGAIDGGNPSSAVPVDTFVAIKGGAFVTDCKTHSLFAQPNVTQGNITVKSA
jgi:hypothetical protein